MRWFAAFGRTEAEVVRPLFHLVTYCSKWLLTRVCRWIERMRRSLRPHFATVITCGCGGALLARFPLCRLKLEMSSVAKSHFVLLMAC